MTRGTFSADQVERLLKPIKPGRVYQANGQAHVAGWEIKAHLTRMFGFGRWQQEVLMCECIAEDPWDTGKVDDKRWDRPIIRWWTTYRAMVRLSVFDTDGNLAYMAEEVATGSADNQPSRADAHDLAMKEAVTQALKRCAIGLGDQFGLSLYDKGSLKPVVGMTLVRPASIPEAPEPTLDVSGENHQASPPDGVGGDAADRESEVALETGDAGPGRAAASPAARQGDPGPADPGEAS